MQYKFYNLLKEIFILSCHSINLSGWCKIFLHPVCTFDIWNKTLNILVMESIFSWKAPIMSSSLTQPRRGGVEFFCFFMNKLHLEHKKYHTKYVICCSWRAPMPSCLTQPLRGGDAKPVSRVPLPASLPGLELPMFLFLSICFCQYRCFLCSFMNWNSMQNWNVYL